jgi:transcription initiation factor TFIID subunit 12
LLDAGDDFLESIAAGAAALAKHRKSDTLEASDVRLHVERVWGMQLPGAGSELVGPPRRARAEAAPGDEDAPPAKRGKKAAAPR